MRSTRAATISTASGGTNSSAVSSCWTRRSNRWLAVLASAAVILQLWIVYQATNHHHSQPYESSSPSSKTQFSASVRIKTTNQHQHKLHLHTATRPPRILIGILGNANDHQMGVVYRDRHRQLFQLWNDSRLCTWKEFDPEKCQVAYTFVLGGHNATSSIPTYHLGTDNRPLTLNGTTSTIVPQIKDVGRSDMTILNIRENMNEGKTPTFFHWASGVARELEIDYVMKCDSDSFLRWNALWRFLYKELPWPRPETGVPSTLLGAFRHKAYWTTFADETMWQKEWYAGMHLYLAGQLYLISRDVSKAMVVEARKWYTSETTNISFAAPYFAGHEDHDATSMIQQNPEAIQRWMSIPKHTIFWEHPVKGNYRWERILAREQRRRQERLEGKLPALPHFDDASGVRAVTSHPSLLAILLETFTSHEEVVHKRELYLQEWKRRNEHDSNNIICPISKYAAGNSDNHCGLYYVFVVGVQLEGPSEALSNVDSLLAPPPSKSTTIDDTWYFNVRHNIHQGLGTTLLYYLHQKLPNYSERLELVVLIQSRHWLILSQFQQVVHTQSSGHTFVVGEMRDKYQAPREFPQQHEDFWYHEFDNVHLYLGSECLGFGSSLVAGIVEQAQTNTEARSKYWENNLGHDLSVLAYFVPKAILHWVPVTKSLRFWESYK